MTKSLDGNNRAAIGNLLTMLRESRPDSRHYLFMPPLVGTPDEINSLGDSLATWHPTTGEPHL